jgi:hypothetical protein
LPRIVPVTLAPSKRAPANSKMAAAMTAFLNDKDFAATEDAKALATSFAPMPNAMMNPKLVDR